MKGGFQKQIRKDLFEVSSNHVRLWSLYVEIFWSNRRINWYNDALSKDEGLGEMDIAKIVQDSINSVGNAQRLYGG